MQAPRLVFLLVGLVERRYLLLENLRHWVLLSTVAVQAHEREEAVRLSVFRFAVGEAGKPPEPPPVRRAWVSVVALGQCLRGKASEELRKHSGVLDPSLKVAGAGLDNSTWVEAVGREPPCSTAFLMAPVAKASSESKEPSLTHRKEKP